ncbi:AAA family ATPase [Cytobacillus spongiae]|jgi:pilus assembly protein CpaE|uniref:AAA family ATPase n=1 Tax=Cytobacillus spongiae TaxID=2901381 RepID=UPI001F486F74|nr:AAA family ATPase [Cytobacillus spongiae]UII56302.1 AAA family ATPase [Cytobacillus spongiae]
MESNLKVLLVSDDEIIHNQILNALTGSYTVQHIDSREVVREVNRDDRDIVIFVQPENDIAVESIQYIKSVSPSTLVIYIAKGSDFTQLRNITKAGASEFFVYPDELSLFMSRVPTIFQNYEVSKKKKEETFSVFTKGRGQIYSIFSGAGGSGKSNLAATLAQTIKLETTAEVILIDLNLQFGGIETLLSIESNRSIADLTPVINELNESHIRNVSQKLDGSKLDVLISPCDAEAAESITEEFVAKLLRTCRRSFDFVIVDLPSFINSQVVTAIEESDQIFYVLTPDTPALKVLKQFEELSVRLGIELPSRTSIILNKIGKDNEVQGKDLKNVLRFPIAATVRMDHKGLQPFLNKGEPVRKTAKERRLIPFAKDVRKWGLSVLG